jgi:hypothetical protein
MFYLTLGGSLAYVVKTTAEKYNALAYNGLVDVSLTQRYDLESSLRRFILLSRCTTVRVDDTMCGGLLNKIA